MAVANRAHTIENGAYSWDTPVTALSGVGPKRATTLGNLGIRTVGDLVMHTPRAYLDRRDVTPVGELTTGASATVIAEVVSARAQRFRRRGSMCVAMLKDDTGDLKATWFGRGFIAGQLTPGKWMLLTGEVVQYKGVCLRNPEYRLYESRDEALADTGRLEPIYPLTDGISQYTLRGWMRTALDNLENIADPIPAALVRRKKLMPIDAALRAAHFPNDPELAQQAMARSTYAEALALQSAVVLSRRNQSEHGISHALNGPILKALSQALSYEPTRAQRRCVREVLGDMAKPRPMARLLQGDVGSGKTCVALHAAAAAVDGEYQVAVMAPTEVLAEQHFRTFHAAFAPLGIRCALLTGSSSDARGIRASIANGETHIAVGTHALFQDTTAFQRLGLAIIDEQHRFGVEQRARLTAKAANPDVLHMTATPLPRSLALTVYGRMDISIIDAMPPGRKPVKTRLIPAEKEGDLWGFVAEQAMQGSQSYVICPLVEDSESSDAISVERLHEELTAGPLRALEVGLLHGRLSSEEKQARIEAFRSGAAPVLLSTTVVEVGVDVSSANIMVILDAHRFGITQLHQLRGRVGRGGEQAYCFLLGDGPNDEARARLNLLCSTTDGFEIAEADLEFRGPGEMRGLRQSGFSEARLMPLLRDPRLIDEARRDAESVLRMDPELSRAEHAALAREAGRYAALIL